MSKTIDTQKIDSLLTRGVEQIIEKESLVKKLHTGKKLRIKHGIDPTGPKIHLGRATQLWKLRALQDLGHKVVLIIGDFTAQIGDASDKDAMRKTLTEKEVKQNMKNYLKQIGTIIDLKKAEIHYNNKWLGKLSGKKLIELATHFTAQQLIHRRNFEERWKANKPIGLHELTYPILQGYDSVIVKADVEIGGSDQLFNLLMGREIQPLFKQRPQDIMTFKMLSGTDGRKMSTSWGNIITLVDTPEDMYGKLMSMKDETISEYLELCTELPLNALAQFQNPRDAKAHVAHAIVARIHGEKAAARAEETFNKTFRDHETPNNIPTISIQERELTIVDLIVTANLASSKSEAQRLIKQGAVKINNTPYTDWKEIITIESGMTLQVGKRRFAKIS